MGDHDASPPSNLRPRRATRQPTALDLDDVASSSFDPEAAVPNSFTDSTFGVRPSDVEPLPHSSPPLETPYNDSAKRRSKQRAHKHRSSGAFLLSDPIPGGPAHSSLTPSPSQRRLRNASENNAPTSNRGAQDRLHPLDAEGDRGGTGFSVARRRPSDRVSSGSAMTKGESLAGETAVGSSPRLSVASLDMDSAQIVKMALNLSESRRLASRRNVSQPIPPRLAPLPDASTGVGGGLRQHLQQQRRASRTISPKPDRSPKVSAPRVLSPLQSTFESEGSYRYHFSQSTLARAQKAKEYLELMAQYRRVLDMLPPLNPSQLSRSTTASPPGSPNGSVQVFRFPTNDSETKIGRPYDPLQYIRNRKVRARERKAIDGESQGFDDVSKVSEWVDDVSRWAATGQMRALGTPALPPFASADAIAAHGSPPTVNSRPAGPTPKTKRPRVDWVIDPADMLADIYWLEQDDNKKLVEDRHWRRVFPQDAELYRPLSSEDHGPRLHTPGSTKEPSEGQTLVEKASTDPLPKTEHEHVLSTARDRAQQKLRALRGSHHRHGSSIHGRDFLRIHRGSLSESSDTDNDLRRRGRSGTISSTGKALLAKQMEHMIAQEQREAETFPRYEHEALGTKFGGLLVTPEREMPTASRTTSNQRTERAELSENEIRLPSLEARPSPPQASGRASLEVPARGRLPSVDYDTSQPNSPDIRPLRDSALVPAIGMDLSPMSSRPSSPSRNPLTKVKSIFRERSKDRTADIRSPIPEDSAETPLSPPATLERTEYWDGLASPDRIHSQSPSQKGGPYGSHRSHRSIGTVKLRGEDGTGLRSLFKAPRIDSVLRSSVSKVSDMIWRKDSGGAVDEQSSSTSSDESEPDRQGRGRSRGRSKGRLPSRNSSQLGGKSPYLSPNQASLSAPGSYPASRPVSRRSSRFELLKPPRIDVQNASPTSASPPSEAIHDISEAESRKSSYDVLRATTNRLNAVLALPPPHHPTTLPVSKRDIARLRAALLSYGVKAREIESHARQRGFPATEAESPPWSEIATLSPDPVTQSRLLNPAPQTDLYPLAGAVLETSIREAAEQWSVESNKFRNETAPELESRVEMLRFKLGGELTGMTQIAADEADEANHDLVTGQRLKV
ncbi:hypothetical protein OQA88_3537 [Cercophora sp. LCS_1]